MPSTSARKSVSPELSEILNTAASVSQRQKTVANTQAKQETHEQDKRFENIASNPFYQMMFSTELSPEQKKEEMIKTFTFEGTKEENKERVKAFELFKEYLQNVREEMAQEIIRLTDTEAFSELKSVYDDLNTALNDFDDKMKPLTDIIDAVYTLRTNNKTFDAFREIQEDRKSEKEAAEKRAKQAADLESMRSKISDINNTIATLGEQKGLFGLGGVKKSAREEIARRQLELDEATSKLDALTNDIASLTQGEGRESGLGEFAKEKEHLRELLDISTDEHKERQKALVQSAITFVSTAKERIGKVREHLGKMNDQVENLFDANGNMLNVYAIMSEGLKGAETNNQKLRESLDTAGEGEDMIKKMAREQKKMAVEQHIAALDTSAADTTATLSDLTSQSIRIKTMKDANDSQIAKARTMHAQGIAGVADRLSVVLQAVSSAALGESSAMAKDTLSQMTRNTNTIAQKESIRVAMGITEQNDDLAKAIDDLDAYGQVVRATTKISREGLEEMRGKLSELQELAKGVQGDVKKAIGINAEVDAGHKADEPENRAAKPAANGNAPANPFKFGMG